MSEYKIDLDIPSMKKEQLKTIRVNAVRALRRSAKRRVVLTEHSYYQGLSGSRFR